MDDLAEIDSSNEKEKNRLALIETLKPWFAKNITSISMMEAVFLWLNYRPHFRMDALSPSHQKQIRVIVDACKANFTMDVRFDMELNRLLPYYREIVLEQFAEHEFELTEVTRHNLVLLFNFPSYPYQKKIAMFSRHRSKCHTRTLEQISILNRIVKLSLRGEF